MKNSSSPIFLNKITDEVVIEILNAIIPVFEAEKIEYFIVGAFARDLELLAKGLEEPPARKTNDLDLAVMLSNEKEFENLKSRLVNLDGFELHETEPIKLIFKEKYEIDLLPFGAIENQKGRVELKAKKTFVLEMPGFAEVFPSVDSVQTDQGYDLKVSSLSGVVLLKLIAWDDRKERKKDIQDIEYIIRNLFLLSFEEIFETNEDLVEKFENEATYFQEMVTARFIGRQIGKMIASSPSLSKRVKTILLENIKNQNNSPMGQIMSFEYLSDAIKIIEQIHLGIQD